MGLSVTGRLSLKRVSAAFAVLLSLSAVPAFAQETGALPVAQHNRQKIVVLDGTLAPSKHDDTRANAYFTIRNDDDSDHLLKGITSPACSTITAHHTNQEQTQATNDLFSHLALPHNSDMIFPVSGYHLLCGGVQQGLQLGQKVPFTFEFLDGDSITLGFTVEAAK